MAYTVFFCCVIELLLLSFTILLFHSESWPQNLVTSTFVHFCLSRKMQVPGATELASKGPGVSGSCNSGVKVEIDDPHEVDKIRCPCGSSLQTDSMIKVRQMTFSFCINFSLKSHLFFNSLSSLHLLYELALLLCVYVFVFNVSSSVSEFLGSEFGLLTCDFVLKIDMHFECQYNEVPEGHLVQ